jgi:hypothetical protein
VFSRTRHMGHTQGQRARLRRGIAVWSGDTCESTGEPFESRTPIRFVVSGFDRCVHSIDSVSMVREEKPGPPIGPGTPSWRARLKRHRIEEPWMATAWKR